MKLKNSMISAIDLGSANITVMIAERHPEKQIPLIRGFSRIPSQGIKQGSIINIEKATHSITQAVSAAEKMANGNLSHAYIGLSGDHIRSMNSQGMISISRDAKSGIAKAREIEQDDIDRVLEHTRAVPLPVDREILHVLPQEYIVDDQDGIENPLNLSGRRLEVRAHVTTYGTTAAANILRCLRGSELDIDGFVLSSLAASESVLTASEKELGAILIDIGSGIVDVIVYFEGGVRHTGVVNLGAYMVTNDVAYLLRIPMNIAEKIKKDHGYALAEQADKEAYFKLESIGGRAPREIQLHTLSKYIEPRMEELLREAYLEAKKADIPLKNIPTVVITGGGALLKGSEDLAEKVFQTAARIGTPDGFEGQEELLNNPSYATAVGILKYAIKTPGLKTGKQNILKGPLAKIGEWIKNLTENVM